MVAGLLLISAALPVVAMAGTTLSLTGAGTSGSGGGDAGGKVYVWSAFPKAAVTNFTTGVWNYQPSIGQVALSKMVEETAQGRAGIGLRDNPGIWWYQVYLAEPNADDVLGVGTNSTKLVQLAPDWGIYSSSNPDPSAWGSNKTYYIPSDVPTLYKGAVTPSWNYGTTKTVKDQINAAAAASDKSYRTKYNITVGGSVSKGSSLAANAGDIINTPSSYEGRYLMFAIACRDRGQAFGVTKSNSNTSIASGFTDLTAFIVQRPRVRVNIVDQNGKLIGGASWTLATVKSNGSALHNFSAANGSMVGSTGSGDAAASASAGNVPTDITTDSALQTAIVQPARDTVWSNSVLPETGAAGAKMKALTISIPAGSGYTFAGASTAQVSVKRYDLSKLATDPGTDVSTALTGGGSGVLAKADADGNWTTLVLSGTAGDIAIGRFIDRAKSISTSDGGFYDITIVVNQLGANIQGKVYNDNNGNGTFDAADTGSKDNDTVELVNSSGAVLESTTANNSGDYNMALSKDQVAALGGQPVSVYVLPNGPSGTPLALGDNMLVGGYGVSITEPSGAGTTPGSHAQVWNPSTEPNAVRNFGLKYLFNPNPTPPSTVPITGNFGWLNSNRKLQGSIFDFSSSNIVAYQGKQISRVLEHAEMLYPANPDWNYYRFKSGNKNIQPAYTIVSADSAGALSALNQSWRRENASVASTIPSITVPSLSPVDGTPILFGPGYTTLGKVYQNGRFVYTLGASGDITLLKALGTEVPRSTVITDWTSGGSVMGNSSGQPVGLPWNGNGYLTGTAPLAGGVEYYGIALYHYIEYDPRNYDPNNLAGSTILNQYYMFDVLNRKTINIYSSVGTN
jgi:hypothetical protein